MGHTHYPKFKLQSVQRAQSFTLCPLWLLLGERK